jgi:protease-4
MYINENKKLTYYRKISKSKIEPIRNSLPKTGIFKYTRTIYISPGYGGHMPDSIIKASFRGFTVTFCSVFAAVFAVVLFFVGFSILFPNHGPEDTALHVLPNHTWRVKPFSPDVPTILQIPIVGEIGEDEFLQADTIFSILKDLQEVDLKAGMLKAIVLRINSPGGLADDSEQIFRMLVDAKRRLKIPVYAYVDGLCASGGLMVSLSADKIVASSQSVIGSVGALYPTAFNFSQVMDRLGIQSKTQFAGKDKDSLNPFRPWSENEGENRQQLLNYHYRHFVSLVARHRPRITEEQLIEWGAGVFCAEDALKKGFIDQVNDSFFDNLEEIARSLDIVNRYQVIELQPRISLGSLLFDKQRLIFNGEMQHYVRVPGDVSPRMMGKVLYMYRPGV